ncbi:MAG: amidohydrolase family protein [Clostridiales bacterium]|nr:amidohydrolase family protein [Clostridiales bacterium]
MKIIDSHTHIYPDKIAVKASNSISDFYSVGVKFDGTVGKLLERLSNAGISECVVHSVATTPAQVDSINRFIAKSVSEHPDVFFGFATLHPDSDDIKRDVDNAIAMGLHGIKLHPDFQKFNADSDEAMRIYEAVGGRLPILIHAGDYRTEFSKPERILNVCRTFPKQDIIAAHFGGWSVWGECAKELADCGIYVDTSSTQGFIPPERVRELLDIFSGDRILFGSDYPMWDAADEIKMLNKVLREEEKEKVFHENFENLMKKYKTKI